MRFRENALGAPVDIRGDHGDRDLYIAPDLAGWLLEVVVHAMTLRRKFYDPL